jgi:hypothetical protein
MDIYCNLLSLVTAKILQRIQYLANAADTNKCGTNFYHVTYAFFGLCPLVHVVFEGDSSSVVEFSAVICATNATRQTAMIAANSSL